MTWTAQSGVQHCRVFLNCPSCGREREHEVTYVGGLLRRVECGHCGQRLAVRTALVEAAYLRGLTVRIATKPIRLGLEARCNPRRFARSLPGRLVTKPPRLVGEVAEVIGLTVH